MHVPHSSSYNSQIKTLLQICFHVLVCGTRAQSLSEIFSYTLSSACG
jgi:hypothetical protein